MNLGKIFAFLKKIGFIQTTKRSYSGKEYEQTEFGHDEKKGKKKKK